MKANHRTTCKAVRNDRRGHADASAPGNRASTNRLARRCGFTVLEMMVAGLVSVLLGAGLWTLVRSGYDSQYEILNQNQAYATARQVVDTLADALRGASGLTAASATDMTFTDSAGSSERWWLSGTSLMKQVNGLPAGGTAQYSTMAGVTFSGLNYNYWWPSGATWTSGSAPGTPGNVDQVDITITVTQDGSSRQICSSAKLREKP